MSYVKGTLLQDEQIISLTQPHLIIIYPLIIWLLLFFAILIFYPDAVFFAVFIFILGCLHGGFSLISYWTSEYGITNKRVVMKIGFIKRQAFEIYLDRIEGIIVDQSILGRMLNYGTIVITGIGGSRDAFPYIPNPLEFRAKIHEIKK